MPAVVLFQEVVAAIESLREGIWHLTNTLDVTRLPGWVFRIVALIILPGWHAPTANAQTAEEILRRSQSLYLLNKPAEALEVIESEYITHPIEYNLRFRCSNTEQYLAELYRASGQLDRGVRMLYRVYREDTTGRKSASQIGEVLFGLALEAQQFEVARQVLEDEKAHAPSSDKLLSYARVYAGLKMRDSTLSTLRRYFRWEYAESRNRVLAHREFGSFYSDSSFRFLMTDSRERLADKIGGMRSRIVSKVSKQQVTPFDTVKKAAEIYKKVVDIDSGEKLQKELAEANKIIVAALPLHSDQLFNLLRTEKTNTYYRLSLAMLLAAQEDTTLTRTVVWEVQHDNFLKFPNQLFWLTYSVARSDADAAKPLLRQMLKGGGGSVFLPQHFARYSWDGMLRQVFGIVEDRYIDDLIAIASHNDSVEGANALNLLVFFQEERVVPLLMTKIARVPHSTARQEFIRKLGSVNLPATITALEDLKKEAARRGETDTLESRLLKSIVPPKKIEDYGEHEGLKIDDKGMKAIFLNNLECTWGTDVSFMSKTILMSVDKQDIPALRRIRASIMHRMSDEAEYDYGVISTIMNWLQWEK